MSRYGQPSKALCNRSSFPLASSLAQFARISSGLGVCKRSTKTSLKGFNSLLSEVSEDTNEVFEPLSRHNTTSTRSSNTEYERGLDGNEHYRDSDESSIDQGKFSTQEWNSVFSRFLFKWRKTSCEDKSLEYDMSNNQEVCRLRQRSTSQGQLFTLREKNHGPDESVEDQPAHRHSENWGSQQHCTLETLTNPKVFNECQNKAICVEEETRYSERKMALEKKMSLRKTKACSIGTEIQTKSVNRLSWSKKCSFSLSFPVEQPNETAINQNNNEHTIPLSVGCLNIKRQRYKTFHGPHRNQFNQQFQCQRQFLQVQHVTSLCAKFPFGTPTFSNFFASFYILCNYIVLFYVMTLDYYSCLRHTILSVNLSKYFVKYHQIFYDKNFPISGARSFICFMFTHISSC